MRERVLLLLLLLWMLLLLLLLRRLALRCRRSCQRLSNRQQALQGNRQAARLVLPAVGVTLAPAATPAAARHTCRSREPRTHPLAQLLNHSQQLPDQLPLPPSCHFLTCLIHQRMGATIPCPHAAASPVGVSCLW